MAVLTREQQQSFQDNGFLLCPRMLAGEPLAAWRQAMRDLLQAPQSHHRKDLFTMDPAPSGAPMDPANPHRVWRIMDPPLLGDLWFRLICEPRIVMAMSELLGPDINFHNSKAILKPPHFRPKSWGWHQDFPYERHSEPDLAAALVYLDDMEPGAGATEVVPGSHRQGEWIHPEGGSEFHTIPEERIGPDAQAVSVKAGDVLFLHVLTVHRAGPNESDTSRCAVINEYKTAATRDLWGNRLAFAEMPLVRDGKPFYQLA